MMTVKLIVEFGNIVNLQSFVNTWNDDHKGVPMRLCRTDINDIYAIKEEGTSLKESWVREALDVITIGKRRPAKEIVRLMDGIKAIGASK